jgi:hypothetical protein
MTLSSWWVYMRRVFWLDCELLRMVLREALMSAADFVMA